MLFDVSIEEITKNLRALANRELEEHSAKDVGEHPIVPRMSLDKIFTREELEGAWFVDDTGTPNLMLDPERIDGLREEDLPNLYVTKVVSDITRVDPLLLCTGDVIVHSIFIPQIAGMFGRLESAMEAPNVVKVLSSPQVHVEKGIIDGGQAQVSIFFWMMVAGYSEEAEEK